MDRSTDIPQSASAEEPEIRRKRLRFRSWHRGTRESDLLLGSFADMHLDRFDAAQIARYETLLDCDDADILDWITRRCALPPEQENDVTRLLLSFRFIPRAT